MTPAVATSRQKVVHILTKGEKALLLLLLLLVLYVSVLGANFCVLNGELEYIHENGVIEKARERSVGGGGGGVVAAN